MYACLAVTCHLHFWQNDRDFLRATVVTRGWNGYRNKSQHRKSTLEKKILPPFQQGFEPATFQSRVRRSNHWAIPAPYPPLWCLPAFIAQTGAGIAQWLERRTRDWKVASSNPRRSGGRIFFSRVNFLCWLLFRYPFHPRVTGVARKRSRSFCQKCRWQVTAKHAYTLRMWLCMKWVTWSMVVWCTQNLRRHGCSFMWHQPCQRCKYTTSVDIQKNAL